MTCSTSNSQETVDLELEPEPLWLLLLYKIRGFPEQPAGEAMGCPSVTLETAESEPCHHPHRLQFCLNHQTWMPLETRHLLSGLPQSPLLPIVTFIPQTSCHLQFMLTLHCCISGVTEEGERILAPLLLSNVEKGKRDKKDVNSTKQGFLTLAPTDGIPIGTGQVLNKS